MHARRFSQRLIASGRWPPIFAPARLRQRAAAGRGAGRVHAARASARPICRATSIGGQRVARGEDARRQDPAARPPMPRRPIWRELDSELRRQTAGIGLDVLRVGDGIVIRIPAALTFDTGSAAVEAAVRRHAAGDRADGEDAQPDLRRRARPHRHHRARRRSTRRCRDKRAAAVAAYLAAHGVAKARIASRGLWRKRAALQSRRHRDQAGRQPPRRDPPGRPTAASAARRRSRAAARRIRPRRSRRARRAGDGRSAGRKCARRGPRRRPWGPRRRSAAP